MLLKVAGFSFCMLTGIIHLRIVVILEWLLILRLPNVLAPFIHVHRSYHRAMTAALSPVAAPATHIMSVLLTLTTAQVTVVSLLWLIPTYVANAMCFTRYPLQVGHPDARVYVPLLLLQVLIPRIFAGAGVGAVLQLGVCRWQLCVLRSSGLTKE